VDADEAVLDEVDRDGVRVVLQLLEKALIRQVKRRIPMRIERFCRAA
jgi:hypothetical protein